MTGALFGEMRLAGVPAGPAVVPGTAGSPAPGLLPVLGLDLSLTSTGVCLPDGTTLRIKTRQKDGDRRLLVIRDVIRDAVRAQPPRLAVIEDLPIHAMGAGITAHVHGIVKAELLDAGVPYGLVVPATLKSYACDHGRADKARLAAAAFLAAGVEFADDPGGDRCDAWWLRAAGLDWWGTPLVLLPEVQRVRLGKAKWPAREAVR